MADQDFKIKNGLQVGNGTLVINSAGDWVGNTIPVSEGGTGVTTSTGTGSVVLSASPTFTGTPLSTTAAADTNTTQIATTAFVLGQASSTTPAMNGVAATGTSLKYARADHVHATDTSRAPLASPTFTGTVTLPGDPSMALHAATKQYVDNLVQGLDIKPSVKFASTGNLALSGTSAIDGPTLVAGDRVLVKNQTTAGQNGIYVVAAGAWTLATDIASSSLGEGAFVWVEQGTTNGDTGWVLVDASAKTWTQFTGVGQITAGAGLTKTAPNQIDVVGTTDRITVSADSIDIASNYVGQNTISTLGIVSTGTWEATDIALAHGGTGASLTAAHGGVVYSGASALALTTVGSSGQLLVSGGAGAPTWTSAPTLNSLVVTGGLTVDTNTLFVDATNNRVGIGTTSPTSTLSVQGHVDAVSVGLPNADPTLPTVTVGGTSGTAYYYFVQAVDGNGNGTSVTTGEGRTSNIGITVSWTAVPGAASYNVWRTGSGVSTMASGTSYSLLTNTTSLTYTDNNSSGNPTTYTSGRWGSLEARYGGFTSVVTATADITTLRVNTTYGVQSSLIPYTSNTYSLGSSNYRWSNLYTAGLTVDTTTLVVDSTSNRVGVGTATPTTGLEVLGDTSVNSLTTTGLASVSTAPAVSTPSGTGTAYFYFVQAYDVEGNVSAVSPTQASSSTATALTLTWSAVAGAAGYHVWRNTTNSLTGGTSYGRVTVSGTTSLGVTVSTAWTSTPYATGSAVAGSVSIAGYSITGSGWSSGATPQLSSSSTSTGVGCRMQVGNSALVSSGSVLVAIQLQPGMKQGFITKIEYTGISGSTGVEIQLWRVNSTSNASDLLYWSGNPVKHVTGDIDAIPVEVWGLTDGNVYLRVISGGDNINASGLKITSVRLV